MSICSFGADVDGDYPRYRARDGKGDKVYPTELDVLEARQRGEDEKCEEHVYETRQRALQQAVVCRLEPDERPYEHRYDFYADVDGHDDGGG